MYILDTSTGDRPPTAGPGTEAGKSNMPFRWMIVREEGGLRETTVFGHTNVFYTWDDLGAEFLRTSSGREFGISEIPVYGTYDPGRRERWAFDSQSTFAQRVRVMRDAGVVLNGPWWHQRVSGVFMLQLLPMADSIQAERTEANLLCLQRTAMDAVLQLAQERRRVPVISPVTTFSNPDSHAQGFGSLVVFDVYLGESAPLAVTPNTKDSPPCGAKTTLPGALWSQGMPHRKRSQVLDTGTNATDARKIIDRLPSRTPSHPSF